MVLEMLWMLGFKTAVRKKVRFQKFLPSPGEIQKKVGLPSDVTPFLIYDQQLVYLPGVMDWIKYFDYSYPVTGGEDLKSLENFPETFQSIYKVIGHQHRKKLCFVSLGGGSVGDFVGFLASVFKRGSHLVHIPTTWVACLDSAHGGKTALNVGNTKNQVGTFYPANGIFVIEDLLKEIPPLQVRESLGEFLKMVVIKGKRTFEKVFEFEGTPEKLLNKFKKDIIDFKYEIVRKDPYNDKGIRDVLNLGHTLGHVLEGMLGISHGLAVAQGVLFSVKWSHRQGHLSKKNKELLEELFFKYFSYQKNLDGSPIKISDWDAFYEILKGDKKSKSDGKVKVLFIKSPGNVFSETVSLKSIRLEAQRQGW